MKKILAVVTNTPTYGETSLNTGLWLSELTHLYHLAKCEGFQIIVAGPKGGHVPIDPESLKSYLLDRISKGLWQNEDFRQELLHSRPLEEMKDKDFDLIYLAGGHGTMFDFPNCEALQYIIRRHYERGRLVAAICHGVSGLIHVTLHDGTPLIKDKKLTGFSWFEEIVARRKNFVPFSLEAKLKMQTPYYLKALLSMTSKVVVDGNLITGQNPFSSKVMAKVLIEKLRG